MFFIKEIISLKNKKEMNIKKKEVVSIRNKKNCFLYKKVKIEDILETISLDKTN